MSCRLGHPLARIPAERYAELRALALECGNDPLKWEKYVTPGVTAEQLAHRGQGGKILYLSCVLSSSDTPIPASMPPQACSVSPPTSYIVAGRSIPGSRQAVYNPTTGIRS